MKKVFILVPLFVLLLTGCGKSNRRNNNSSTSSSTIGSVPPVTYKEEYGVFLGANSSSINQLINYKNICIDLDEFSASDISLLKENQCTIYGYLSVGSLEKYRSYYETFKDLTFMDYENWPDERWIDVSNTSWQSHIISEATRLKGLGADGLFLDNFDVYYIANEEYEGTDIDDEAIYHGCESILSNLGSKELKLMVNSGTDFLERLHDESSTLLSKVDTYVQECVFSSIEDYENDVFGRQNNEDQQYYLEIISFMKNTSKILLIEYTKDALLKEEIKSYCRSSNCYYYISETVKLTA